MAIIFDVGFRIKESEFNSTFKGLIDGISSDISKAVGGASVKGLSKELSSAVVQAKAFESAMRAATTDKGISYSTLVAQLAQMGTSAEKVRATLAAAGPSFSASLNQVNQVLSNANRQVTVISSKIQEIERVMTQSLKFTIANSFYQSVSNAFREAINWTKELNSNLTQIQVVSGKTASEMDRVYEAAIRGSRELRVAASDYAEASLIYYQQGLGDEEVAARTQTTIKAAQAAGQSVSTMASQLTAVWNTYQMSNDQLERSASVGARLAADTAVDFKDIAEAMQISATAASQMGVSYESLAAIIATVGDTTQQSASVIGNAYKTIFSRFYNLVSEGEDGGVTLGRISQQLKELGINILDVNGDLIPLDNLIQSIGNSWDTYSQKQQIAIAEIVGGTRQYGQFLALMQNFDKYLKLLGSAQSEGTDTLEQQYTDSLNSVENAALNASEAWSIAFSKIINEDTLKSVYNLTEALGNIFGDAIDAAGGLENILKVIGALILRRLTPSAAVFAQTLVTAVSNLTPTWRENNIKKSGVKTASLINQNYDTQAQGLKNQIRNAPTGSYAQESLKAELNLLQQRGKVALENNKLMTQASLAQDNLNDLIQNGNAEQKIWAQGQKEIINNIATEINKEQDKLRVLDEQVIRQKTIRDLQLKNLQSNIQPYTQQVTDVDNALQLGTSGIIREPVNGKYTQISTSNNGAIRANAQYVQLQQLSQQGNKIADQLIAKVQKYNQAIIDGNQEQAAAAQAAMKTIINSSKQRLQSMQEELKVLQSLQGFYSGFSNFNRGAQTNNFQKQLQGYQQMYSILQQIDSVQVGEKLINPNSIKEVGELSGAMQILMQNLQGFKIGNTRIFSDADIQALQNGTMSAETLAQKLKDLKAAAEGAGAALKQTGQVSLNSILNGVGNLASGLMMCVSGSQMLAVALSDAVSGGAEDANLLMQTMMGLATTLPGIVMTANALKLALQGCGVAAAALNKAFPILLAISAAITLISGIVSFFTEQEKKEIEAAKEAAEAAKEQASALEELNSALQENTNKVEENYKAYQKSLSTGEDVQENYNNLIASLDELNDSMELTGDKAIKLQEALSVAFSTGNFSGFYEVLGEIQNELDKEYLEAQQQAMTNSADAFTKENTTIYLEGDMNGWENSDILRDFYSQRGYNISKEHNSIEGVIDLREKSALELIDLYEEQYELLQLLEDEETRLEEIGNNRTDEQNHRLDVIKNEREVISGNVDLLKDIYNQEIEISQATLDYFQDAYESAVANSGYDFGMADFGDNLNYLHTLAKDLYNTFKDVATDEQIQAFFNQIVLSNADLNKVYAQTIQLSNLATSWANRALLNNNEVAPATRESLQNQFDTYFGEIYDPEAIIRYVNEPGSGDTMSIKLQGYFEMLRKLGYEVDRFLEETDSAFNVSQLHDFVFGEGDYADWNHLNFTDNDYYSQFAKEINSFFEKLDPSDREILLSLDFSLAQSEQDLQKMLDNYKNLHLTVDFKFRNEDDIRADLNKENSFQSLMSEAISNYQDNQGYLDLEVVEAMIDSGLDRYIVKVGDEYKLTSAAAKDWNTSLQDEKRYIDELLVSVTDTREPIGELMEQLSGLQALVGEQSVFGSLLGEMQELNQAFVEGGDLSTYLTGVFKLLDEQVDYSAMNWDEYIANMSDYPDTLEKVANGLNYIANALGGVHEKLAQGLLNNEILPSDYLEGLIQTGEAAYELVEKSADVVRSDRQSFVKDIYEQYGQGLLSGDTGWFTEENLDDISMPAQSWLTSINTEIKDYNKNKEDSEKIELIPEEEIEKAKEYDNQIIELNETKQDFDDELKDTKAAKKWAEGIEEAGELAGNSFADIFEEDSFDFSDTFIEKVGDLEQPLYESASKIGDAAYKALTTTVESFLSFSNDAMIEMYNGMSSDMQSAWDGIAQSAYSMAYEATAPAGYGFSDAIADAAVKGQMQAAAEMQITITEAGKMVKVVQGHTETVVGSTQEAIARMITGISNILSNFNFEITVGVNGNITLNPTWSSEQELYDKLLSGQIAAINPESDMKFTIGSEYTGSAGQQAAFNTGLEDLSGAASFMQMNPDDFKLFDPSTYLQRDDSVSPWTGFRQEDDGKFPGEEKSGGSDRTPKDLLDEDDYEKFHERYEDLTKDLERLTDQLDDLSDTIDNAWGADKITAMNRYNQQIQRIGRSQAALIKETEEYYQKDLDDFKNALSPGALAIAQFSNGEFPMLENPEAIRSYLERQAAYAAEQYNQQILAYNQNQISEEQMEAAEEKYNATIEDLTKQNELLNQLFDTENLLRERINEQVDNIRNWLQNKIDKIEYKLEFKVDISDYEIEQLERMVERLGDVGLMDGSAFKYQGGVFDEYMKQIDYNMQAVDEAREKLSNLNAPENQDWFKATFGDEAWEEFKKSGGILPDSVMSFLEDQKSVLQDNIESLYDSAHTAFEMLNEAINLIFEEYERLGNDLKARQDRLDTLETILEYQGDPYSTAQGRESLRQINEARRSTAVTEAKRLQSQYEQQQKRVDILRENAEEAYEEYLAYQESGNEQMAAGAADVYNQLKAELDGAEDELVSLGADVQSAIQEVVQIAEETWDDELEMLGKELAESLGGMFSDLSELTEMYDAIDENQNITLDEYDKNYHLNKLQDEVDSFLENQTDPEILENMALLQEHINAYRQEGVDITEREVEILNQALAVEKARAEFEDQRNAKNTMRLARDASGNWNYVYSTDNAGAENDAANGLADAEYEYKKLYEEFLDNNNRMAAESVEQLKDVISQYDEYLYQNNEGFREWYDTQIAIALDNLNKYTASSERATDILEDGIIDYEYVFSDSALGIISKTESLREFMEKYKNALVGEGYDSSSGAGGGTAGGYLGQIIEKQHELREQTGLDLDQMGEDWDDLQQQIEDETADIIRDNEETAAAVESLERRASIALDNFSNSINAWRTNFINSLQQAINKIQEFLNWLQQIEDAQMNRMDVGFDENTDYTAYLTNDYLASGGDKDKGAIRQWLDTYHKQDVYERMNAGGDRGIYSGMTYDEAAQMIVDHIFGRYDEGAYDGWNYGSGESDKELTTYTTEVTVTQKKNTSHAATGGLFDKRTVTEVAENGPELVLNKDDTKNVLEAVRNMREVVKLKMASMNTDIAKKTEGNTQKTVINKDVQQVDQQVSIEATFPNVSVAAEIEEALNNLINQAVQYATRNNR